MKSTGALKTAAPGNPAAQTHDLFFTRIFDAPLAKVWKAWSDPGEVKKWWGPDRFACPFAKIDFRLGGTSLVCMRAPKEFGGQDHYSTWKYQSIEPMRRIEYIHNLANKDGQKIDPVTIGMPPDFPQDQRHLVTFKPLGDRKTELNITEFGWSVGHMMEMSKLGMEQCLDKMAAALAGAKR